MIRSFTRVLVAVAGFLTVPFLSLAAIVPVTEGNVFSSGGPIRQTSQFEASVDEIQVAGTWPAGTIKLIPGAGSTSRQHPQDYVMLLCVTPSVVSADNVDDSVAYQFRWQNTSNYHQIKLAALAVGNDNYQVQWVRVKNGVSETQVATASISIAVATYVAVEIVISGVAPAVVTVYTKDGNTSGCTLGAGAITQRVNQTEAAGTQGLASWTTGEDRLIGAHASILWRYYDIQRGNTYTLTGLPSTREAMLCSNTNAYLGKVTSAAPTFVRDDRHRAHADANQA